MDEQQNSTPILVLGILSIVLSGIVGIILSSIAKSKVKAYKASGAELVGPAKAGSICATIGMITSIIYIIAIVIYAAAVIALGASGAF